MPYISRLAPTPSGYLHVGNGINFVLTYLLVKKSEGTLYLRIDDFDVLRVRKEYIDNIFASLEYLEISWDKGAKTPSEYYKNYKYSQEKYLYELENIKDKLYPCECSRKDIKKHSKNGIYQGTCRDKNLKYEAKKHALRYNSNFFENIIIWRKENLPSYNFASLIDDKIMKTSLIVRGEDLYKCSEIQLKLAKELNIKSFLNAKFIHHKLCLNENGLKLSKSTKAPSLLNEKSKKYIYEEVAKILKLPIEASENIFTLSIASKDKDLNSIGF